MKKTVLSLGMIAGLSIASLFGQKQAVKLNLVASPNSTPPSTVERCSTPDPGPQWDAWFNQKVEEYTAQQASLRAQGIESVVNYTIPVIVHVIHNGEAVGTGSNISSAQVQDQINILNADYAGTGLNSGNVPSAFSALKANCNITFCLALKDPNGNTLAEPGIHRVQATSIAGISSVPTNGFTQTTIDGTIKPATIWNVNNYCNMWTLKIQTQLLGYATFPAGSTLSGLSAPYGSTTTDGLVMGYNYFGSIGAAASSAPYNKGRTTTHEIGHWLGLRHIWGDNGQCGASDYCVDTPPQKGGTISPPGCNYGCPTHPFQANTCTRPDGAGGANVTNTNGDMFMNFMDYTDDACMYMFTNDQRTRIQTCMANGTYRVNLNNSASTLCSLTPVAPTAAFTFSGSICQNTAKQFTDQSGGIPTSWAWSVNPSAGVTITTATSQNPTITFPNTGSYTVSLTATNAQGNNSTSQTVNVINCSTGPNTCPDTLTNYIPADTLTVYLAGADAATAGCSPKAGYVLGSNCYDDKEKAEFYAYSKYSTMTSPQITGAIVLFYKNGTQGTTGASATACNLVIYNGTMATGPVTPALATKTSTLGAITATTATNTVNYAGDPSVVYTNNIIIPYKYTLTTPINAPSSNGFFASVTIPTGAGDTAVIMNNISATAGTTWEKWSDNTWHDVQTAWGGSLLVNAAILPLMSCNVTTGYDPAAMENNFTLFPNPTKGMVNFAFTLPKTSDLNFVVTNAIGQVVMQKTEKSVSSSVVTLDLSNNAKGVYFINVINTTSGERVVKKLVID